MSLCSIFLPKSLMFTLTGFVRSFISRKAYLLSLCTCEWLQGQCVKGDICVKFGNGQCKSKWDTRLSSIFISSLCFSNRNKQDIYVLRPAVVYAEVELDLKPWIVKFQKQKQTVTVTILSDRRDLSNVSDHIQVKLPQFSRHLQLLFKPPLWRWH